MPRTLTIGELSKKTQCKVPTIRYFEDIGLLPPPSRTSGNQRRYEPEHVRRLVFIQHCRELGFQQNTVRDLLSLIEDPSQNCEAVTSIARARLEDVNRRITRLSALKDELERMIEDCQGGEIADCQIIGSLDNPKIKNSPGTDQK